MTDLQSEIVGTTLWVTFNRPEVRNALTFEMYENLAELCENVPLDGTVRSIILSGAGGKAFAAGTDMTEFRSFETTNDALEYEAKIDSVLNSVEKCPIPTIAVLTGSCTGGGAAIAAACDVRIASSDLKFGFPIARTLGNCLSTNNLSRLSSLLGMGRVREMMLTARLIDAIEAKECGLVSEVHATSTELMKQADQIASRIADMAPLTLKATKIGLHRIRMTQKTDDSDLIEMCYMSDDFKHGIESFLSKSKPKWKGK